MNGIVKLTAVKGGQVKITLSRGLTDDYFIINNAVIAANNSRILSELARDGADDSADNAHTSEEICALAQSACENLSPQGYTGTLELADIKTKGPWVDVRAFGAKGDGITDDTDAIQAAINTGKPVFIPMGTYMVRPDVLTVSPRTTISGSGHLSALKLIGTNTGGSVITGVGDTWGALYSVTLKDFAVWGNWDSTATPAINSDLIHLTNFSHCVLDNLYVRNSTGTGIRLTTGGYTSLNRLYMIQHYLDGVYNEGFSIANSATSTSITQSTISTCLRSSVHVSFGFNIISSECIMEDSGTAWLVDGTNYSLVFEKNYVENLRGNYDCDLTTSSNVGISIINNYLAGTSDIASIGLRSSQDAVLDFNCYNNGASCNYAMGDVVTCLPNDTTRLLLNNTKNTGPRTATMSVKCQDTEAILRVDGASGGYTVGCPGAVDPVYLIGSWAGDHGLNCPINGFGLSINAKTGNGLEVYNSAGMFIKTGAYGDLSQADGYWSSANAKLYIARSNTSNRSVNAAGTINASGADYAEYMYKANPADVIAKGEICGVDATGKVTKIFADSVTFVVKSTDPSYVGNDMWGQEGIVGIRPVEPKKPEDTNSDEFVVWEEQHQQYLLNLAEWEAKLESERQKVDRIAFAGQVPVNVLGAIPGQYIIPAADGGRIKGIAVSNPTFEQYQNAVGKVIAVEDDGRARIMVKVA